MPELEAWEKVIITGSNGNQFLSSVHGQIACQDCHGGAADSTFTTMAEAHVGLTSDPSATGACDGCHATEAAANANSLHTNLWGEKATISARCGCTFEGSAFEGAYEVRCGGCHTTCGQCHISRPASVGGGFPKIGSYYSHRFRATPDMNEQCTACHGSRIGADFKGELAGNVADVHRTNGMQCQGCHTKEEIHGDNQHTGAHYVARYEVATMPRCEDASCHGTLPSNTYHSIHVNSPGKSLQCQVCHSQPYKNCTNCHNLGDEGVLKSDIDPSVLQLKIARNPSPYRTGYDYALVRHVPVDPDTFADWGLTLTNYLDRPTWVYTSPHNIQRWTAQTTVPDGQSCTVSCHGTQDGPEGFFLRESDLYQSDGVTRLPDYDANIDIVIPGSFPGK